MQTLKLPHALMVLRPLAYFYGINLVLLGAFRLAYWYLYHERASAATQLSHYLLSGVRADFIMLGYGALLVLLVLPIFLLAHAQQAWQRFSVWLLTLFSFFMLFMELATPAFIAQYDTRPNRLFFEYLAYPAEVFATLWHGFRGWLILSIVASMALGWGLFRVSQYQLRQPSHTASRWQIALILPLALAVALIGVRSTWSHRPANPAFFATTADPLINSLHLSSGYTLLYALYNLKHESQANRGYSQLSDADIFAVIKTEPYLKNYQFSHPELPTLHYQPASIQRDKPLNIVIILEESLGATFVPSLGGKTVNGQSLTPNLEQLKQHGWWFEQLYATGIRSVRGIEAVVAGFLPTRARSTVKLTHSQRDFFTLASLLRQQHYHTEFLYGGEAHFDNMASFFSGNGFASIVDQRAFTEPKFEGSWGVSDEDLLDRLHQQLMQRDDTKQPYFVLAFSSSNHEPFEYPADAITPVEQPVHSLNNAVRYADHALGKFFAQAMASDYWHNTLFLVVADHDTRVYGDDLIPVSKFHIPGLILGADLSPKTIPHIASQIDLLPTLISLAGLSGFIPAVGQDLSAAQPPANRAMMQFGDYFGWLEHQQLTVLGADQQEFRYQYDPISKQLTPLAMPLIETQEQRIRAFAALPSVLYQQRLYRLPEPNISQELTH